MNKGNTTLRRVLGIGVTWAFLWLVLWAMVGVIIGIADPDSIDPGDASGLMIVFGSMGLLTGISFGSILSFGGRDRAIVDLPLIRAVASGILACAIVQVAYLGHGDQGLIANIKMALLFSAIGGIVTVVWLVIAQRWLRRHRVASSPSNLSTGTL